jgi:hypothetical protein
MADVYAEGTFEPGIPDHLLTEKDRALFEAIGVSMDTIDGKAFLYHENYATSGFLADGEGPEVTEDDLYAALQDIIRRSNGELKFITHEQAYTCEKMAPGQFGGSAAFITADDFVHFGTSGWLEQ